MTITPKELYPFGSASMKTIYLILTVAVVQVVFGETGNAQTADAQDRTGMRCISSNPFPVPTGSKVIPLEGSTFETGKAPVGWGHGYSEVVSADDAPEGKFYLRMKVKKGADLRSPVIPAESGRTYFLSYWLKNSDEQWTLVSFTSDERDPSFNNPYPGISFNTANRWKRVGFYFWMPTQCKTIQFQIVPHEPADETRVICIDDIQLRTATDAEAADAYQAERAHLPPYDIAPRPGDGKNLALSVAKWEGRAGIPGKPFVVWALGSSYTAQQADGFEFIQAVRKRFPNAPPIMYRKHGGPGTPWEYVGAWVKQFVAAEQPDLIFTYTTGTLEGLDALLTETRRHTTAEIIVPSVHFKPPSTMSADDIEKGAGVDWSKAREICAKHGAEFVENRREMAEYLAKTGLNMDELLYDHNHQNQHGRIRIWDNVTRHLARSDQASYTPESRERRLLVTSDSQSPTEKVTLTGNWTSVDGVLRSSTAGCRLKVSFTGNRIDLIGRKTPGGGAVKVQVDGIAGDQAPVFVANSIVPSDKHLWRIPHVVDLGQNLVSQKWTITMTSDTGDYRVEGSVAGPDGVGNLGKPFVGSCGQIGIDPKSWRQGRVQNNPKVSEYGVANKDSFTFDVMRASVGELNFAADKPTQMVEPIVRNLPNRQHTIELTTADAGEILIEALYVYQPPEGE